MNIVKEEAATDEEQEQPLKPKPLLSLAPIFPAPSGYDLASSKPVDQPLLNLTTTFRPSSSSGQPSSPVPASFDAPICLEGTPMSGAFSTPRDGDGDEDESSRKDYKRSRELKKLALVRRSIKRARPTKDSDQAANVKPRSRKSVPNKEPCVWQPSLSDNPRASAEEIMIIFDSLRRRTMQLDEKKDSSTKRADLKAGALMMQNNTRINNVKMVGHVPGLEVGDIFFYRIEMCIVGLHAPAMAGIDYMPLKIAGEDEALAVCIISSGGYENEDDGTDILVYTGQGGNSRSKEKHDQKLERGNLALMNSKNKNTQIRVVRSTHDPFRHSEKIYIYDGLYRIEESWTEKAKNGFNVFKYKLRREPGQPDGISIWKIAQKWKENPETRENVIQLDLSSNVENLPVCLVNDVGNVNGSVHFNYVTGVKYLRPLSREKKLQSCKCHSVCLPGDTDCSCVRQNGGDLPYTSSGLLVKHTPMVYECSSNCLCSENCRNRVTQKGIILNFEVFWTGDRGWGLRSWDPIHAGAFICEYAGEVIDETKMNVDVKGDDYIFHTSCPSDKVSRWNRGTELLEETSTSAITESFKQLPIIISSKDSGNVARFLNHSCSPNLLWQAVQYDHGDDRYPHIMFFAIKHIPPMTELTYDYGIRGVPPGFDFEGKFRKACKLKPCLCGSTNCRGYF